MERYFDKELAISLYSGGKIENTLETIAFRYMGANPRRDYTARPFFTNQIIRNKDYRYEADFRKIFPDAQKGSYVYVYGKYKSETDGELKFTLIPKGPVKIWMNSEKIFNTTVETERYDNMPLTFNIPVKKGWNHLVLRFTNTDAGFGAEFGTWLGKLCYYFFRGIDQIDAKAAPFLIEGFDYTTPLSSPLENPSPENLAPLCVPLPDWTDEEKNRGVFERIFPQVQLNQYAGGKALAVTDINLRETGACSFRCVQNGKLKIYAGNTLVKSFTDAGAFDFKHELKAGRTRLTVISERSGDHWGFRLSINSTKGEYTVFSNPFFGNGDECTAEAVCTAEAMCSFSWIYAGPFKITPEEELLNAAVNLDKDLLIGRESEKTFWRLDRPGAWVRLYNESPLYGHWNYPLGVTLYGLIETARFFSKDSQKEEAQLQQMQCADTAAWKKDFGGAIGSYVESHGVKSVRTFEYALFDKEHFGGATAVHHLLTSIDSLDDCGSFGSLIMELAKDRNIGSFEKTADYTANHILNKQDLREEGCFWRKEMMHHFHNGTLWADDLYMSVPFLCRYAQYKNDRAVLDTAALQFEGFKKHLYMEDKKLMAHVYDFKRKMNNGIPWGRGNGWTIFSLTELLMVLPDDHSKKTMLLGFFRDLASGYLACQDENGMWHQVLNMKSSYIESSCTAMFICAFSRGIRCNWFEGDTSPYRIAAQKAWKALENYSIDKEGNIHGVCRGSEFAFNPRYYAEHLLPRLNDTHGIGIILLAGVELLKLHS